MAAEVELIWIAAHAGADPGPLLSQRGDRCQADDGGERAKNEIDRRRTRAPLVRPGPRGRSKRVGVSWAGGLPLLTFTSYLTETANTQQATGPSVFTSLRLAVKLGTEVLFSGGGTPVPIPCGATMVRLKSLRVENYKAFEDATFVPDDSRLTVVVGANGSGKTSLWEILGLLSRLAPNWQLKWLDRQFGGRGRSFIGCLPWHQADRELRIEVVLGFGEYSLDKEATYQIGWTPNPETGHPELTTEVLVSEERELLRLNARTGRYESRLQLYFLEKNYPLMLSAMGRQALQSAGHTALKRAFDDIGRWGVFRFRIMDLGKDFERIDITSGVRENLTTTGDNLLVVLHAWRENPSKTPFVDLRSLVRLLLDRAGLKDVDWDIHTEFAGGSAYAFLRFRRLSREDSWFDMAYGPDGFKAYLQLMTALLSDHPLVAIEEPENHIEPRLLDLVARQMEASAARGTQVIATTHSPLLAQAVPVRSIRVLRNSRFEQVPDVVKTTGQVMDAWLTEILHDAGVTSAGP